MLTEKPKEIMKAWWQINEDGSCSSIMKTDIGYINIITDAEGRAKEKVISEELALKLISNMNATNQEISSEDTLDKLVPKIKTEADRKAAGKAVKLRKTEDN